MSDTAAQPTAVPLAPASLPAQDAASAEPVASVQQGTPDLAQGRPADAAVSPSAAEQRLPVRTYLEQNVVPILMQAMMELNRKRPADPIDFLCTYLQQHKTQRISDKN